MANELEKVLCTLMIFCSLMASLWLLVEFVIYPFLQSGFLRPEHLDV